MYVNFNNCWFFLIIINLLTFWITSTQGQQMSRRRTSNVCRDNSECPMNAYCERTPGSSNGQCICHHGFIIVAENGHRECYKEATTIGDFCTYNEQCMITLSTESDCRNGRCQCLNGTHFVERSNKCYKSVKIGDFCRLTNNCIGEGSVCRSGICRCPSDKHPTTDMTNCILDVQLSEKCNADEECVADNTRCHDICRCRVGHVINSDAKRCLKVATHIYDDCEEDHQCTGRIPYSACDKMNQTCACKTGYHELKYKCWVSVALGQICEVDENCALIDRAICLEGRCICRDGWKQSNGYCSISFQIKSSQRVLVLIFIIYLFIS